MYKNTYKKPVAKKATTQPTPAYKNQQEQVNNFETVYVPLTAILNERPANPEANIRRSFIVASKNFDFGVTDFINGPAIRFNEYRAEIRINLNFEYITNNKDAIAGSDVVCDLVNTYSKYNKTLLDKINCFENEKQF